MSTQYIIKFCKNIETSEPFVDGFVELIKTPSAHNIIEVRTKKDSSDESNTVLVYKIITSNFATVTYDDISMECFLEYKDYYRNTGSSSVFKSVIKFDKSSSSAYTDFKKNFIELTNTQIETVNYANGRVWYIGEVLHVKEGDKLVDRVAHGQGTLYYDGAKSQPKYVGEFENGKYDGAGIFYSYDGKLSVSANNISNGIPTQKGKLSVNFNKFSEVFEVDFSHVFEKWSSKYSTKDEKQIFARSDDFVKIITQMYWNNDEPIERTIFREQTVEDKQVEIWNKLNELTLQVESLQIENKKIADKHNKETQKLVSMATILVIFTHTLLYIFK
jgi:hypothetical protein